MLRAGTALLLLAVVPAAVPAQESRVLIEDLKDGEHVGHQLLLVRGTVGAGVREVVLSVGPETSTWPAAGGRFKALALLKKGDNAVAVRAEGGRDATIRIHYAPPPVEKFVRLVYVTASDGDGTFQAPPGEPNDVASAKRRIVLAGLLMQTATAELMRRAGFGRKTFRLERDAAGDVRVRVYKDTLTMEEAHAMKGRALWSRYARALGSLPDAKACKNVAFMQMTRYIDGKARAHTALGGGRLGLFGSGGMHTWAENPGELVRRFSDGRKVSTFDLFPDVRKTFWGNYATTVGAALHETGHTFGLPHSGDPDGVMERGFDHFNRIFMVTEGGRPIREEKIRWAEKSASKLDASPWFAAPAAGKR